MSANFLTPGGIFADGYGFVPKMMMRDKRLSVEAKAIYSYLSSFAGAGMTSFPSVELIIEELGMSEKRFYKHRKLLVDCGYVSVKQEKTGNKFAKNVYVINTNLPYGSFDCTQNESAQNACTQNASAQNDGSNSNSLNNNNLNSNSSNSNSKKVSAKKSKPKFDASEFLQSHNVSDLVIQDFIAHRKNKKAEITMTALNGIIREAGKANISLERALTISIERNWVSFNASWKWQDDAITIGGNVTPFNAPNQSTGNKQIDLENRAKAVIEQYLQGQANE